MTMASRVHAMHRALQNQLVEGLSTPGDWTHITLSDRVSLTIAPSKIPFRERDPHSQDCKGAVAASVLVLRSHS